MSVARGLAARAAFVVVALLLGQGRAAAAQTASAAVATASPASRANLAASRPWSVRMSESVLRRHPEVHQRWDYTAGLVLMAIHRVAEERKDPRLSSYVRTEMDRFIQPDGSIRTYRKDEYNLDQINQGRMLFPLMVGAKDDRYRKAADLLRDQLRTHPRTKEGGFWHKQIYPQQMWLDGLYMAGPFYAQYALQAKDTAGITDVYNQFLQVARYTRDVRTGLLHHAWDESHSQRWADSLTGRSLHAWGRGAGWYMMAIVDALDFLPANHPKRPALLAVLRDAAEGIEKVQDPMSGLWYQVMDQPGRTGNYLEASASAMFVYAFAKAARLGYLDRRYRAAAERGYDGLIARLISVDADGIVSLNGICQVAGLGGNPYRDGTYGYYIREPIVSNDFKGVGPFILASVELKR